MKKRIDLSSALFALILCVLASIFSVVREKEARVSLPATLVIKSSTKENLSAMENYRIGRDEMYDRSLSALLCIMQDENAKSDLRAAAEQQIITLSEQKKTESAVEGALCAWGAGEGVCIVNHAGVTVVCEKMLTEEQAGAILELAAQCANTEKENVKILQGYAK